MQSRAKSVDDGRCWREVAFVVARRTGKSIGLDAARMAMDADLSYPAN